MALKFKIETSDYGFLVVDGDDNPFGDFKTKIEAESRLNQILAAQMAGAASEDIINGFRETEYASLSGVEIMRVGTWNGDKFTSADLDDIVDAFEDVGFKPPVKLGHAEKSGDPAFGFVTGIKRVGDRLLADLSDIPKKLADMINERRFDAVSSEIFFNLKRGDKLFRRALKAVALLGAEIPAVAGLKPLRESLLENSDDTQAKFYSITTEEMEMSGDTKTAAEKKAAEDAALVATLTEQVATLTASLDAAKKDGTASSEAVLKVQELSEMVAALTKQNAESEETRRQEKIDEKVAKVPFPALRKHFSALYNAVTSEDSRTANFSIGEDDKVKISAEAVLDDLCKRLTKFVGDNITSEISHGADFHRSDGPINTINPGIQLDVMATAYAKKEDVDYERAFDAVCADPENAALYAAYSEASN